MEFFSRLIRGGPTPKSPTNANSPHYRLAVFKRLYNGLLQIWKNGDAQTSDPYTAENLRVVLRRLAELLEQDARSSPSPYSCIAFAATSRILVTIVRTATAFHHDGATRAALDICRILLDSEEELFLEDRAFADILPEFVRSVESTVPQRSEGDDALLDTHGKLAAATKGEDVHSAVVEVLFGVAAKLRLEPHVLRVWFRPETPDDDDEEWPTLTEAEKRTRFQEFPLFYLLLNEVPRSGRAGEFARMGLLYIIEMAAQVPILERWIVQGDMAAMLASGLGALYSQLSRKLALTYPPDAQPAVLTFSDRLTRVIPADAEATTSTRFQAHLSTFLASFIFWQDILEHCPSVDIAQTLLDHYRYLFLQQLLYPSLIESSDIEGGSSVAVLMYLRYILESLENSQLVRVTLRYLFGLDFQASAEESSEPQSPLDQVRRQKSESLLASLASEDSNISPELFNLSDLIVASLQSSNQQTITATLAILSALLRRPHHQTLTTLLRSRCAVSTDQARTVGGQEVEVEQLLAMAESLSAFQDLESAYAQHLHDNKTALETHPCAIQILSLPVATSAALAQDQDLDVTSKRILVPEDPTLKSLVALLDRFFENDIETNLALTQVLVDLASCGYTRLEGWLVSDPSAYTFSAATQSSTTGLDSPGLFSPGPPPSDPPSPELPSNSRYPDPEKLKAIQGCRRHPLIESNGTAPILQSLKRLLGMVNRMRRRIPEFDAHLLSCRGLIDPAEPLPAASLASPQPSPMPQSAKLAASRTPTRVTSSTMDVLRKLSPSRGPAQRPSTSATSTRSVSTPASSPPKSLPVPTLTMRTPTVSLARTPPQQTSQLPHVVDSPYVMSSSNQTAAAYRATPRSPERGTDASPAHSSLARHASSIHSSPSKHSTASGDRNRDSPARRRLSTRQIPAALQQRVRIRGGEGALLAATSSSTAHSQGNFALPFMQPRRRSHGNDSSQTSDDDSSVSATEEHQTPNASRRVSANAKRGSLASNSSLTGGGSGTRRGIRGDDDAWEHPMDIDEDTDGPGLLHVDDDENSLKSPISPTATITGKTRRSIGGAIGTNTTEPRDTISSDAHSHGKDGAGTGSDGTVELGQLLTQVILLQEFVLELATLIEARASLFSEIRYF